MHITLIKRKEKKERQQKKNQFKTFWNTSNIKYFEKLMSLTSTVINTG